LLYVSVTTEPYTLSLHDALPILIGIVRFFLGKRRDLDGMIHHKGRLDQMLLHEFFKEQIQDLALLMPLLIFHMMLLREGSRLLQIGRAHVCTPVTFRPRMPSSA